MTDDELDDLAEDLAKQALAKVGHAADAAAVLYQASTMILISHFPADRIAAALTDMMTIAHSDVMEAVGQGATRQ